MNTPQGKGIYIWKSANCSKEIADVVQQCVLLGLKWVAIKIGDAASTRYASFKDMPAAVAAFRAAGMSVWGWHYIYGAVYFDRNGQPQHGGASPEQEAGFAVSEVKRLGLDGYIIDAEKEYKVLAPRPRAERFMAGIKNIGCPVGLSSYRFPRLHPELPWTTFLAGTDIHMPQVYWQPGGAVSELDRSIQELTALKVLPFVPAGRAYIGDGHPNPTPAEITAFMMRSQERNCVGVFFWALDYLNLHAGGQERAKAIAQYTWSDSTTPPAPPTQARGVRVTASVLNVRVGPGVEYRDTGDLTRGAEFDVLETSGSWAQIGRNAWVAVGPGLSEYIP